MSVVVPIEHDAHAAVQALLPWYLRGQLADDESRQVQAHLALCADCRGELEAEQPLQALLSLPAAAGGGGVEAGLAKMRARLKADPRSAVSPRRARWLAFWLGLEGCAIAVLLVLLVQARSEAPAYKGLAAAAPATAPHGEALIMFSADASERGIRELLQANHASIIGGPTESGAYLLRLNDGEQALPRLRAAAIVTLVESLEPGSRR